MRQQSKEYIVILFVVAALALNYPFLDLFDRLLLPLGIPLLYFYLYLVWFVIILLLAVVVEHSEQREPEQSLPLSEPRRTESVRPEPVEGHLTNSVHPSTSSGRTEISVRPETSPAAGGPPSSASSGERRSPSS